MKKETRYWIYVVTLIAFALLGNHQLPIRPKQKAESISKFIPQLSSSPVNNRLPKQADGVHYGNDNIPKWLKNGLEYTYQDAWDFCWFRILIFTPILFLFIETRFLGFLFLSIVAFMKIPDEQSIPFDWFSWPESVSWIIATLVTLMVYMYRKKNDAAKS